jgi:hypothetical protein
MEIKDSKSSILAAGDIDQAVPKKTQYKYDPTSFQKDEVDGQPYKIVEDRWYQAMPYGFRFYPRQGKTTQPYTFYLPISPSDITITTHFATNVIPTLYGTVEEHSEQRYFDIVIAGTTGIAPKYTQVNQGFPQAGREGPDISIIQKITDTVSKWSGGFFGKYIGQANNIANKATDTLANVIPSIKNETTGVHDNVSGYVAFHRLYKFLLAYKRDIAGAVKLDQITHHPLEFINYKDHNKYKCSIQRFILRRTARDPLLYEYNIVLRAYELTDLSGDPLGSDLASRLDSLGLNGKSGSVFSKIKSLASGAKSVAGSAASMLRIR